MAKQLLTRHSLNVTPCMNGNAFSFKAAWFPYDCRRSQIAESSAIVCDHMETHFCDRLRSCDHLRSFAILRSYGNQSSAICDRNVSHIFLILTDDSTLLSHKARMFVYSNAHLLLTWLALNIVARYECVYNRNSKNFKDKHKKCNRKI